MNCLILGWVTNAMVSIISVLLGPAIAEGRVLQLTLGGHNFLQYTLGSPEHTALLICVFILIPFTGIYTSLGGLWGVLVTDLFQFVLKMVMVVVLAWVAVAKIGGMASLKLQLSNVSHATQQGTTPVSDPLAFLPNMHQGWSSNSLWTLPLLTFATYLAVQWWSAWYPGAEPGGGGYVAQRMFSAKNEKHSLGATLWFNIAHYAVRPWPWIIVALASLIIYPDLASIGAAFPHIDRAIVRHDLAYSAMLIYLPHGLLGLMVASLAAAYMSTISTHLNWGASYAVEDCYRRFIAPDKDERHYVNVGRIVTVFLIALACAVSLWLEHSSQAFQILLQIGAGTGLIFLLRWFWWRVNAWSELAGMVISFLVALYFTFVHRALGFAPLDSTVELVIGVAITTVGWLLVTFLTPPTDRATLQAFYDRIRPMGPGWRAAVQTQPGHPGESVSAAFLCWFLGVVVIYAALFGTGYLLYGKRGAAIVCLAAAAVAAWGLFRAMRRVGFA